jgi:hypothetical protein
VLRPGCGRSHRISSNFTGTFPGYDAVWVDLVVADGSGKVIPLAGNDLLRIRFSQATAMMPPLPATSAAIRSDRHAVTSQR